MLDKLDYINRFDSDNALAMAAKEPNQLDLSLDLNLDFDGGDINNIVYCGMGGSALAANVVNNWLADRLSVPFVIIRDYDLPAFVDQNTLVICSSYSGNTEETVSCFNQAITKEARVVVITSGGELEDLANKNQCPLVKLEPGHQPRMMTLAGVKAVAEIFKQSGITKDVASELKAAQKLLLTSVSDFSAEVETAKNPAKQIADQLMGKAIWVYGSNQFGGAVYKWKIGFNENAKTIASYNLVPELDHNELLGWTSHPVEKPFAVVELRSHLDSDQINKRFDEMNKLLSGRMPRSIEVQLKGQTHIEQLLWASVLGEFVSIYLGILNGVNPTSVDEIENFKQRL